MDIVTYALLNGKIKDYASNVDEWLEENVDPATGYVLDRSLQMENAAAPADMVGDINDEVGDLKNTLNHKADVIYDTASGDIASFPDGADGLPVKDLTVGIEPVQSGTGDPSPTNVRLISGWTGANVARTGKNLFSTEAVSTTGAGVTITPHSDGSFTINGTSTSIVSIGKNAGSFSRGAKAPEKLRKGLTYTLSGGHWASTQVAYIQLIYKGDSTGTKYSLVSSNSTYTITMTEDATLDGIYVNFQANKTFSNDRVYPQFEISTTATAYEPYSGTTIPISWQSEAGTVYGGTLDVTSGVLTVTDANIASYNGETLPGEWISDRDVYSAGATPTTGAQVVYKLATPQTYQLDPVTVQTLLGQNNVWADCGPSTVEYPADTKLYIERLTAPEEDDMIANQNIASGVYFMVGNNLYLSTAAILAGDPIKPGTNCTLTNLAAALNAINS